MALSPKGKINLGFPEQTKIYFTDITGDYNVTSNPGGYGAPNIEREDVLSTELWLKAPGTTTATEVDNWTYLPTDPSPAEIDCEDYTPSAAEVVDADSNCAGCPDSILLTDCEEDDVTCFMDGCWEVTYKVFWSNVGAPSYDVTFNQFFYGQTLRRLQDLTKAVKSNSLSCHPNWDWEEMLNRAWNDYNSLLLNSQLNDCDCACNTNWLASLQRRLTEMENKN